MDKFDTRLLVFYLEYVVFRDEDRSIGPVIFDSTPSVTRFAYP